MFRVRLEHIKWSWSRPFALYGNWAKQAKLTLYRTSRNDHGCMDYNQRCDQITIDMIIPTKRCPLREFRESMRFEGLKVRVLNGIRWRVMGQFVKSIHIVALHTLQEHGWCVVMCSYVTSCGAASSCYVEILEQMVHFNQMWMTEENIDEAQLWNVIAILIHFISPKCQRCPCEVSCFVCVWRLLQS